MDFKTKKDAMTSDDQNIQLARNLERLMRSHKLTITATAAKIGMNKSTLHNYCNGVVPRNLIKIKELADLFGISLNSLLFGENSVVDNELTSQAIEGRYEVTVRRIEKTVK